MKKPRIVFQTGYLMISGLLFSLALTSCSKKDTLATNDQNQTTILPDATVSTSSTTTSTTTKLAFPNATGFAKASRGAYAKYDASKSSADLPKIIYVTNLYDSGTGSLRDALSNTSPRIVIFKVGGTISLSSPIIVKSPYVTVAGYTAPGGGICVKGATISIQTSNVIVRNIRSRNGVWAAPDHGTDGIGISANGSKISNIMIDHCSVTWASDEQIGINGVKGGVENVTIQNCILAEGFLGHAFALLCNGANGDTYHIKNVSIHRNLFVNCEGRNPRFGEYTTGTVINNLIHNWGGKASEYTDYTMGDVLYNKFKPGKNTTSGGTKKAIELIWDGASVKSKMYTYGNLNVGQSTCLYEYPSGSGGLKALSASTYYNSSIYGFTPITDLTTLEKDLLPSVGPIPRDAVDARLVSQYSSGTGVIISKAGTYPTLAKGTYPSNNNGVSLAWLVSKGYATSTTAAASLTASYLLNPANGKTGYSIVEEYINDQSIVK